MNPSKMMADMKLMSDQDILTSMNNGIVPSWMGVSELHARKSMRSSAVQPDSDSVLTDAQKPMGFAQGGVVNIPTSSDTIGIGAEEEKVWNGYTYVPRSQLHPDDPRFSGETALPGAADIPVPMWAPEGLADPLSKGFKTARDAWELMRNSRPSVPMGMSYTPSLPGPMATPPAPIPNAPAPVSPSLPGIGAGLSSGMVPGAAAPAGITSIPQQSNEAWMKQQLDAQGGAPAGPSFFDQMQGLLPQAPDYSELFAKRQGSIDAMRGENKALSLLALGGGMLSAPGSFGMALGAGAQAMTPVAQQGVRDYYAAMQDLAKDEMTAMGAEADLQSRNANTLLGAKNVDIGMENAKTARADSRLGLMLKGRELDAQIKLGEQKIAVALAKAEQAGISHKDLNAAKDSAIAELGGMDNIEMLDQKERSALYNEILSKYLLLLANSKGIPDDDNAVDGGSLME